MTYTVKLHGIAVGRSELEHLDAENGFARGAFRPATGYQLVQDVFRLYAEAVPKTPGGVADSDKLQRYYKARDALGLILVDNNDQPVKGATVHVYEAATNTKEGAFELEVHISDPGFWRSAGKKRQAKSETRKTEGA